MIAVRRMILGLATIGVVILMMVYPGGGSPADDPLARPSALETSNGGVMTTVASRSVGDLAVESTLVVRATVTGVRGPVWNSVDGRDWWTDWEKAPAEYSVMPVSTTPVALVVSEVLSQQDQRETRVEIPKVGSGDSIEVRFPSQQLAEGGEYVFFLLWSDEYLGDGSTRSIWLGDFEQGTWLLDGGTLTPMSPRQRYSLAQGSAEGFAGIVVSDHKGSIDVGSLLNLLAAERKTEAVDVAGFEEWPWEELAKEDGAADIPPTPTPVLVASDD